MLYPDLDELLALKKNKAKILTPQNKSVKTMVLGSSHSPFRGQGLEFEAVRKYVGGDDIRSIDWRVTARTGSPHVKLFREEKERQEIICVDMNASMRFGTKNTFKSVQAAKAAAFLSWQAIARQDKVGACLFGDVPGKIHFFPAARSPKHLYPFLKMLADPPKESYQVPLKEVVNRLSNAIHPGALVYFISDFLDLSLDLEADLKKLNKKGDVIFITVNDQADRSIFPSDMIRFAASPMNTVDLATNHAAGRKAYEAIWHENRKQLRELLFRTKISCVELTTESNLFYDLALGLKMVAK